MSTKTLHTIKNEDAGTRLDVWLTRKNICTSRSVASRWIEEERVLVNGKAVKAAHQITHGDKIEVNPPPMRTSELVPRDVDFGIIYEDADLVVLNKPAGLVVHPGAGHHDESLVHGLLHKVKGLSGIGGVERPGIVHRLDKDTSGVMVVAKNDKAHTHLTRQFQERTVKKQYLALVLGRIDKEEFRLENLMKRAEINRKKFVVNQKKGKVAITRFKLLRKREKVSLVAAFPETGRTHQIRVHLSFAGHPILGDETYGWTPKKYAHFNAEEKVFAKNIKRTFLHAYRIEFDHPRTGKRLKFEVPLPHDMQAAITYFFNDWEIPDEF